MHDYINVLHGSIRRMEQFVHLGFLTSPTHKREGSCRVISENPQKFLIALLGRTVSARTNERDPNQQNYCSIVPWGSDQDRFISRVQSHSISSIEEP